MRQLIAIFFITVLSVQVLPVKEIGKILFKGQVTEEIHPEGNIDDDMQETLKLFTVLGVAYSPQRIKNLSDKISVYIHIAESLPDYHIPEILSPPPNAWA